jgi:hypothetical protein
VVSFDFVLSIRFSRSRSNEYPVQGDNSFDCLSSIKSHRPPNVQTKCLRPSYPWTESQKSRFRSRVKVPGSQFHHITVGDSCSTQGAILACTSDFTRFLYCAFGSSTVAEVDCLTQFPDCSHNELKNDVECPNSGDGYNVEKVDSNGNVIGFHNCVLFNIDGTSQDGVQSGCGF